MNEPAKPALPAWQRALHAIEDGALVALLLTMILLAVAQILLRNLADQSLVWADPFLRNMVLWLGLLGATIAARNNAHIAIDIATRYLPLAIARAIGVLLALFASAVCGTVAWYAQLFVRSEYEFHSPGFASVPAWACEIILPVAFAVIALRYLLIAIGLARGTRAVRAEAP